MRTAAILFLSAISLFAQGTLSNRRAPGFSLPDSRYRQYDIQDFRGKVVLLDIMQTTCPHCQTLAATLEKVRAKYGDRVQILSIVTLPDSPAKIAQFVATYGVKTPILLDQGQVIMSYMKVTPQNPSVEFPHLFLIDAKGMIRNDWAASEATAKIFAGDGLFAEIDQLLGMSTAKK
jgi:peroxiredoxin